MLGSGTAGSLFFLTLLEETGQYLIHCSRRWLDSIEGGGSDSFLLAAGFASIESDFFLLEAALDDGNALTIGLDH